MRERMAPEQPFGGAVALHQNAVDPIPNPNPILKRLDVDVGRPQLHGFGNNQLHQPDDRRTAFIDLLFAALGFLHRFGEVDGRIGELLQHRVGAFADRLAVVAVDGVEDRLARGQRDFDLAIENKAKFIERVVVHRVADDHGQLAVGLGQRHGDVFAGDRFGNQFDDGGRDGDFAEVDVVQAVLLGHRPHHFLTGGVAQPRQGVGQADAQFGDHLLGFGQLVRADHALPDEDFRVIALAFGSHAWLRKASWQTTYRARPADKLRARLCSVKLGAQNGPEPLLST